MDNADKKTKDCKPITGRSQAFLQNVVQTLDRIDHFVFLDCNKINKTIDKPFI
jgi:hypothetical protein